MKAVVLVHALLALGLGHAALAQTMPAVSISASERGYQGPASMTSGFTRLNFTNNASRPIDMQLFKLKSGVTTDAFRRVLSTFALGMQEHGPEYVKRELALFNAAELYGGVSGLGPKISNSVLVNLDPGTYIISTVETTEDPKNPQAFADTGFFQVFTVVKGNNTAKPPAPAYLVQLADFALALPPMQVAAGSSSWEVRNDGQQPHFMLVAPLMPGKTPEDVMKFMAAGEQAQGAPPVNFEASQATGALSPGKSNFVTFNLKPGTYFTACFITDLTSHKPHAELGMVRFFTVR